MNWWVYMILTDTDHFYTGITTDPLRRFLEHRTSRTGAKYFRTNKPIAFALLEQANNRSLASQREYAIKKLNRPQKDLLISNHFPETTIFYESLGIAAHDIPLMVPSSRSDCGE
ncbi:MAG: GIY-YIG nuclease family protein [Cellvibrio sp.]